MPRRRCPPALLAAILAFAAQGARAQEAPTTDLASMTIEQLLEVPLVSVASKRPQAVQEAPSVVTVVTGDEIRRHGYRTLADVLRTLPGFYVSYDRNYSYVGVRGFGRPGDYNTRILLLIDGMRVNDNIYDGAYVGREALLEPEVVERIEVSRGPGAALYGNNAFFAVVNVVTKRGGQLAGGELRGGASSYGTWEGHAGYGRKDARGTDIMASVSALDSAGRVLSYPEFANTNGGVVHGGDGEASFKAFTSFSNDGFFVEALHSSRTKHIPTASYGTVFDDTRALTRDAFTAAAATYERSIGTRFDWRNRIAFTAYDYEGTYPFELTPGSVSLEDDYAHGRWWSAESIGVLRAGRHTLTLGGELVRNARQDQGSAYEGLPATGFEIADHGGRYGAFAQDDVVLGRGLRLSLGARYDHDEDFGGETNPRLALIVGSERRTTFKLLYGSSYRAPNEYEQHYYEVQYHNQTALEPEAIRTVEAALQTGFGGHFLLSASMFSNDIRDLITLESDIAGNLFFRNAGRARSKGGEAVCEARFASGFAGRLSYSYQHTRDGADRPPSNSPSHMLKADLTVPIRRRVAWASVDAQYLSSRLTLRGAESAGFVLVNATVEAARLVGGLEASVSVYNLLDARYADPGSEEHRQDAIRQDGRSVAVRLGWRF